MHGEGNLAVYFFYLQHTARARGREDHSFLHDSVSR